MKNIYHDDSYNPQSEDIFSKSGSAPYFASPEKPKSNPTVDFTEEVQIPAPAAGKPVRSARQAPPPIRRSAPAPVPNQTPVPPGGAYYGADAPYGQQPYYPQPVYYGGNPPQPYPVYGVPGQPYPVYPQGVPYPPQGYVQPVQYPQPVVQQPAAQPPVMQPPIVQTPSSPYTPAHQGFTPPAPAADPLSREAGTRVLFQSPDFDKKDDFSDDEDYETLPHDYKSPASFDVSEVELPSRKRAGESTKSAASSFRIDEMEIGTYELGAMSVSRHTKATEVQAPTLQSESEAPAPATVEETNEEVDYAYYIPPEEESNNPDSDSDSEPAPDEQKDTEEKKEKKKLAPSEIIRRTVLVISAVAIAVSAYMLYNEYRLHKKNEQAMNDVSSLIITEPSTEASTTESTTAASDEEDNTTKATTTTKPTTTRYLTPSEQFELLKQENPQITFPANIQLKYAKLYAENQDFVGYLSADGSDLDFPIVRGEDNDEYIEKDFFGEYTKYGCPFMAAENNVESLDMNTVIYGHHMRDGSLFATLDQYTTLEGYKEAPVIRFNTLYRDYSFKVIAVMITNINPDDDNGYVFNYFWTNLNSALNYTAYLNQLSQRSLYDTGVNVLPTDRLLTLSTCYSEFENARLVVVARLVRPGESESVDTSKAVENPNPRYPQAYYDEYKLTNPYKDAYKWEIT